MCDIQSKVQLPHATPPLLFQFENNQLQTPNPHPLNRRDDAANTQTCAVAAAFVDHL
jgi:hypothetical protein